jgi:hypothetical protein
MLGTEGRGTDWRISCHMDSESLLEEVNLGKLGEIGVELDLVNHWFYSSVRPEVKD